MTTKAEGCASMPVAVALNVTLVSSAVAWWLGVEWAAGPCKMLIIADLLMIVGAGILLLGLFLVDDPVEAAKLEEGLRTKRRWTGWINDTAFVVAAVLVASAGHPWWGLTLFTVAALTTLTRMVRSEMLMRHLRDVVQAAKEREGQG